VLVLDKGRIAAEERIALERPRQPDARFHAIRRRLLGKLGVEAAPALDPGALIAFPSGAKPSTEALSADGRAPFPHSPSTRHAPQALFRARILGLRAADRPGGTGRRL
jgi:hypothetical protein